jgi:predicted nuclease of predicted toxin-antitoxin system
LWINSNFPELHAKSLRSLGLRDSGDFTIFEEARKVNAIIMSKDLDFARLIDLHGTPPCLIWITCGNTSNANMCAILQTSLLQAVALLNNGDSIVEISK